MNIRIIPVLLVVGTAPSPTFASTDGSGLTREQVHEELIQLRAAGYDQSQGEDTNYPVKLQAALARVEARNCRSDTVGDTAGTRLSVGGAIRPEQHPCNVTR
jgi:hypothetical protein